MKILEQLLNKVRSLPEGIRGMLFIFLLILAGVFVFNVWLSSISGRLASIGGETALPEDTAEENELILGVTPEEKLEIEGPLAGIGESLKSAAAFVEDLKVSLPEKEAASNFFSAAASEIAGVLGAGWSYLSGLYDGVEDWTVKNVLGVKVKN